MRLKDLGNLKNITTVLNGVFNGIDKITRNNFNQVVSDLKNGLTDYSLESIKLATSQMTLSKIQAKAIFTAKGLSGAELEAALHTSTLSTAQATTTGTTTGLSAAFKGLAVSAKSFIVANPIVAIAALATVAIAAGAAIYNKLHPSLQEATKDLKEQAEVLKSVTTEVQTLTDELLSAKQKIEELQALGSLSLVEDQELSNLKEVTSELEVQLAIKKEEQRLESKKTADIANKAYNGGFRSKYDDDGDFIAGDAVHKYNPTKELENSLKAYYKLQDEYKKAKRNADFFIKDTEKNGGRYSLTGSVSYKEYENFARQMINLQKQMDHASGNAGTMYETVNGQKDAYEGLVAAGYDLTQMQLEEYQVVRASAQSYQDYCNDINNTAKAFSELSNEQKRAQLESKLILSGKSESDAKNIVGSLSDSELDATATLTFNSTSTKESIKEQLKIANEIIEKEPLQLSISDTIDQLNTQLKPAFDSLKSAYQDIFTSDGFTLGNVDLSMLDTIKSSLDNMSNELALDIDYSDYDNLVNILTNSSSTVEQVQGGFNTLANSIIDSTTIVGGLNEATAQSAIVMLESLGVANAKEVVLKTLNAETEVLALQEQFAATTGEELINVTYEEANAFLTQAGATEVARSYLFKLITDEQVFSSTSLSVDQKIAELERLATAYGSTAAAAAMSSKLAYMKEQAEKSHTTFNPTAADLKSLQNTISSSINNGVKIDFSGISNNAIKAANNTKALGDSAKSLGDSAKDATKEIKDEVDVLSELNKELDDLQGSYETIKEAKEEYDETGKLSIDTIQELCNMDERYLALLVDENGKLSLNKEAFERLSRAKMQEIQIQMARKALDTINSITSEAAATEYLSFTNANLAGMTLASTEAMLGQAVAAAHLRGQLQGTAADMAFLAYQNSKIAIGMGDFSFSSGGGDSSSSEMDAKAKAEEIRQEHIDAFKKELDDIKWLYDTGVDNHYQYLQKLNGLNKKYFKDNGEFLEEYRQYALEYYDGMLSVYDTVMATVSKKLDKQVKAIQKEQDAVKERYETEMEAIDNQIKAYEKQIKTINKQKEAIQEQIDELETANKKREEQIALEEAQYNKQRALSQRTDVVITNDGVQYKENDKEIKKATEELEDLEFEKQIEDLKDAIDSLDKIINGIDKNIESLEEEREALEESLAAQMKIYEDKIKIIEDYQEKWDDLASQYKDKQDELIAQEILGANWEAEILSLRLSTLEDFVGKYNDLIQGMATVGGGSSNIVVSAKADTPAELNVSEKSGISKLKLYESSESEGFIKNPEFFKTLTPLPPDPLFAKISNLPTNMYPFAYGNPDFSNIINKIEKNPVIHINGDLSFPNINNANQVDLFINELTRIASVAKSDW